MWDEDPALVTAVAQLLRKHGRSTGCSTVIGNPFNTVIAEKCDEELPQLPRILTFGEVRWRDRTGR